MIKVILWDIDGTLLNFEKAEKAALNACFVSHGFGACSEERLARYSQINRKYWEALEKGELTKPQVLVGRFREFFEKEGLPVEAAESVNAEYQERLGDTVVFCDNGFALVEKLRGKVKQAAVTNGTKVAQDKKLRKSKLITLLDDVFISDELGVEKPNPKFFDLVFERMGITFQEREALKSGTYKKEEIMIVGDSLTSDIRGGNNAGILTCWYNPRKTENTIGVHVDYEITNLWELEQLL